MSRLNYFETSSQAMKILLDLESYLRRQFDMNQPITIRIWELVKLRVSQINQCAYCIDMHSKDAFKLGESAERIIGLSAWRDMPLFSPLEREALAWAELVTSANSISDQHYQQALNSFGDQGMLDLTLAVNAINSWNRIAKTFKPEVGSYQAK